MFYPICLVYTFTNYSSKICLEDNTERSEINPGRSLGTTTKKKRAVWKTVPTQTEFTCSSLRDDHKCSKSITDNADATDLFFSRISFNLVLPLDIWFTTDCICAYAAQDSLQQEIIRDNHSARQAQTNHKWIKKSVKEQIRRIRFIRDRFWTWRVSRRRKSL